MSPSRPCRWCGAAFEAMATLHRLFWGPLHRHERRCERASADDRAYYRLHRRWPPSTRWRRNRAGVLRRYKDRVRDHARDVRGRPRTVRLPGN